MLDKKLALSVSALGLLGIVIPLYAMGQSHPQRTSVSSPPTQEKSLTDRLNDFGSAIFGGFLPPKGEPQTERAPTHRTATRRAGSVSHSRIVPRAGSSSTGRPKQTVQSMLGLAPRKTYSPTTHSPTTQSSRSTNTPVRIPVSRSFAPSSVGASPRIAAKPASGAVTRSLPKESQTPKTQPGTTASTPRSSDTRVAEAVSDRPLHERFSTFAQSAFTVDKPQQSSTDPPTATDSPTATDPPAATHPPASRQTQTVLQTQEPAKQSHVTPLRPNASPEMPYQRPLVSPHSLPRGMSPSGYGVNAHAATGAAINPSAGTTATATPPLGRQENVLFVQKSPALSVETLGPRQIAVGKESVYQLNIENSGQSAADEVVVFINLPPWADVLGAEASTGATGLSEVREPGMATAAFQWRIGRMEGGSRERLVLRIVPRESRPFDLGVRWEFKPPNSQVLIEVQEPKLVATLDGPREVLYGKQEVFRLKIANTGNGAAENVQITLTPVGTAGNQPVSHNLGTLDAGKEKVIEVELTARQEGQLLINVRIRAEGGVHTELAEKVLVRRPALQLDLEGPQTLYVGAVATYRIRVRNPGSAAAKNVHLAVTVPPGTKYLSGIEGASVTGNGTEVAWTLDSLDASGERIFVMECQLGLAGSSRIEVAGAGDDELAAAASVMTRVQAIADLVLEVKDPIGPIPVGKEVRYEFRIRNRGTSSAHDIEVVGYFSRGIEPIRVAGAQARLSPGQVVFSTIPSIAAGAEVPLTVFARAETGGNHICRVEVQCKSLGTRLVCEETTHYYDIALRTQQSTNVPFSSQRPSIATAADAPSMQKMEVLRTAQAPEAPAVYGPSEPTRATRSSDGATQ